MDLGKQVWETFAQLSTVPTSYPKLPAFPCQIPEPMEPLGLQKAWVRLRWGGKRGHPGRQQVRTPSLHLWLRKNMPRSVRLSWFRKQTELNMSEQLVFKVRVI